MSGRAGGSVQPAEVNNTDLGDPSDRNEGERLVKMGARKRTSHGSLKGAWIWGSWTVLMGGGITHSHKHYLSFEHILQIAAFPRGSYTKTICTPSGKLNLHSDSFHCFRPSWEMSPRRMCTFSSPILTGLLFVCLFVRLGGGVDRQANGLQNGQMTDITAHPPAQAC